VIARRANGVSDRVTRGGGGVGPLTSDGFMTRDEYVRLCVRIAQVLSRSSTVVSAEAVLADVDVAATAAIAMEEWEEDVGGEDALAYYPTFCASTVGLAEMWCASNLTQGRGRRPDDVAHFLDRLNASLQPLGTLEIPASAVAASVSVVSVVVTIPDGGGGDGGGGDGRSGTGGSVAIVSGAGTSGTSMRRTPPASPLGVSSRSARRLASSPEAISKEASAPAPAPTPTARPALAVNRPPLLIIGSPPDTSVDAGHGSQLSPEWTDPQAAEEARYVRRVGVAPSHRNHSALATQSQAASTDWWVPDQHSRPSQGQVEYAECRAERHAGQQWCHVNPKP